MAAPFGNKFALGNNGGRPRKYATPQELEERISEYFETVSPESGNYPTVTGLALFLGFSSRDGLYEYRDNNMFSDVMKRALMVVESHYENRLNSGAPTGAIFALKNMNWKDTVEARVKTETELSDFTDEQLAERLQRIRERNASS